ncbi:MAG: pentapeptide repeat-containing protein, partial [Chloroflexota bacterium]
MSNETNDILAENAELKGEVETLKAENERLKAILKAEGKAGIWLGKLSLGWFLGGNLTKSITNWREAAVEQKGVPGKETDELIASLLKRFVFKIGTVAFLALVPTVLTLFFLYRQTEIAQDQNVLFDNQNRLVISQTLKIQEQIEQQATASSAQNDLGRQQIEQQAIANTEQVRGIQQQIEQQSQLNDINRRAELISILYDRTDCGEDDILRCPHQASHRTRIEAVKAFVEIERIAGRQPDLSGIDLSGANLNYIILTNTVLIKARLISTTFVGGNLTGTHFTGSDMTGANLLAANLFEANLSG